MKLKYALVLILALSTCSLSFARQNGETEVYLLTILPGKEVYSIYGHSAVRIVIPGSDYDRVFNWGVFDFNTSNFGYKFARGRLNYMLVAYSYRNFIEQYRYEQRTVISQRILLEPGEINELIRLVNENLKPENVSYLYDFFYDNCATRIRDLLIKSVEGNISLSVAKKKERPTFRELIDNYQKPYHWLDTGIDLLLGLPADKKASAFDQMFLPDYLMANMSDALVTRGGESTDLLSEPETVLDFDDGPVERNRITSPLFVLWILLAAILTLSLSNIKMKWIRRIDIVIFSFYSLLSIVILFMMFLTDHNATQWNLNVLWLSPAVPVTLVFIILKIKKMLWYRVHLAITTLFLITSPLMPQSFNRYFVPLVLILVVRLFFLSAFGKTVK